MPRGRRSRDRGYISGNRIIAATTAEVLVNYLVVAGGGGGGGAVPDGWHAGGGGAGGTLTGTGLLIDSGIPYTITIGAGGARGTGSSTNGNGSNTTQGADGTSSSIGALISTTGGGGGGASSGAGGAGSKNFGRSGGSGGGGGSNYNQASSPGGTAISGQGNNGGNGSVGGNGYGGGGGGKGSVGGSATTGGAGGTGQAFSITGASVTYAVGGGTGVTGTPSNATNNTGNGGSSPKIPAGGGAVNSANGGSGVVILSYSNLYTMNIGAGLSYSTQVLNNDKITTFTGGSGSISFALAPVTTGDYESIATVLVGSAGASTVTFSNIPQTYKHLQIRAIGRTDRALTIDGFRIQFNNTTTTAQYRSHFLGGNGSSAFSGDEGNTAGVINQRFSGATSTASMFGASVIDILDYTNTNKYKTVRCLGGTDQNGSGEVYLTSGVWMNTAAVNEIDIVPNIGTNFVQYSSFALYGIQG